MMKTLLKLGLQATRNFLFSQIHRQTKRLIMLTLIMFLPSGLFAQSEPEFIQMWHPLEEAEFQFDVTFAVVKCTADSKPIILLNAFNEAGNVDKIGFTLELTDANDNQATIEVAKFEIGKAQMQIASCDSDEYSNLRLDVPEGIDPATLSIKITYNK